MAAAGGVLLVAAVFKVRQPGGGEVIEQVSQFPQWVRAAGLQAETLIGLWLISGWFGSGARLAGIALYAVLAFASVTMAVDGQPSCGCFGHAEVSPWVALLVDVAGLVGLVLAGRWATDFRPLSARLAAAGTAGGLIAVIAGVTALEPVRRELARLRDEPLLAPNHLDAGEGMPGEVRVVTVGVQNVGLTDVVIVGAWSSCGCVATDDLPAAIPAGGQVSLRVRVRYAPESGPFRHGFTWHTDSPYQPAVVGTLTGRVEVSASRTDAILPVPAPGG